MKFEQALIAFDALSQETRLKAFRLLVEHGPDGAPAGILSDALDIPHNTLSFHLNHMAKSGLVTSKRKGRSVIYTANFSFIQKLIRFMVEKCCTLDFTAMHSDTKNGCDMIALTNCCPPTRKSALKQKRKK